jgi:hypothetical protein
MKLLKAVDYVTLDGTQTDCSTHGSELTWNSLMSCSGPIEMIISFLALEHDVEAVIPVVWRSAVV